MSALRKKWFQFVWVVLSVTACRQQAAEQSSFSLPAHFPEPVYTFTDNTPSAEGIALGKKIFYDPILSRDSTISCGSCHKQEFAFADGGHAVSTGILGRTGLRNAPPLFNLLWSRSFMWDAGVNHIEVSGFNAIKDTNEMGEKLKHVIEKMQRHPEYPALFQAAFGSDSITSRNLFLALTQFTGSLISAGSKYDRVQNKEESYTPAEAKGYRVFRNNCSSCHTEPLFTNYTLRNNGVPPSPSDSGRQRITQLAKDRYLFKVPSLRNVAFTAPYMHNGSIPTLAAVLEHYRNGMHVSPTLDSAFTRKEKPGIVLSEAEGRDLLEFLAALSDSSLLLNPAFR